MGGGKWNKENILSLEKLRLNHTIIGNGLKLTTNLVYNRAGWKNCGLTKTQHQKCILIIHLNNQHTLFDLMEDMMGLSCQPFVIRIFISEVDESLIKVFQSIQGQLTIHFHH